MNKIINLIIIIGLTLFFCSCYSTLRTGRYIIEDKRGFTVNFKTLNGKSVEGDYRMPTDSLKIGDTVMLIRVRQEKNANIF